MSAVVALNEEEHETSVDQVQTAPAAYQASCLCGYVSQQFSTRGPATRASKAHTRSVAPAPMPFWQDKPCPSWCIEIHHDSDTSRKHLSAWYAFGRPALRAVHDRWTGKWRPRNTGVRIQQSIRPSAENYQPLIALATEDDDGSWPEDRELAWPTRCTPHEMLELAEMMRRAAILAYGEVNAAAESA